MRMRSLYAGRGIPAATYNQWMPSEPDEPHGPDDGLRRVLTWTLIALIATLIMAGVGVTLAVRFFDRG
jgi:hypothetical protein